MERSKEWRLAMADQLVRCADTVTILRPDEVDEIRRRALSGEFDNDPWPVLYGAKDGD